MKEYLYIMQFNQYYNMLSGLYLDTEEKDKNFIKKMKDIFQKNYLMILIM